MLTRRGAIALFAAGAFAPAVNAHTLYNQWIVYRQKHLLIGSHRQDLETYGLALEVAQTLDHLLPEAKARAARAPHPSRLASLLATRQLELAVLSGEDVGLMQNGERKFAPYGKTPLVLLANLSTHLLVAHEDFSVRHAWLVTAALSEGRDYIKPIHAQGLPEVHPGARAFHIGTPMSELTLE